MSHKRRAINTIIIVLTFIIILATVLSAFAGIYLSSYSNAEMDLSLMELCADGKGGVAKLYTLDGEDLSELDAGGLYGGTKYKFVPLGEMPDDLINAFVAIEDKRFWEHGGVDVLRTASAAFNYAFGKGRSFGASTITQQLIKNLTGEDDYSLDRKFKEIFEAIDLERRVDKSQILEAYLNVINLSGGCEGVGAAAELYFGCDVSELSLAQAASIAAITNNPSRYDPIRHPENNKKRRDIILSEMQDQGYISEDEYNTAVSAELVLVPQTHTADKVSSWYADMVAEDVIRDLGDKYGYDRRRAAMLVYHGGLKIYTSMDKDVQGELEKYFENKENFPTADGISPVTAAIVTDAYSGVVLGVVGATGKKTSNRVQNYATDTRRPSGSAIKPLSVYAPALERGIINWSSVFEDEPIEHIGEGENAMPWPRNANGIYRGATTVEYAIAHSTNTVAVKVLDKLGMKESFDFLKNGLNIKSLVPQGKDGMGDMTRSALALGQLSRGMTLRELVGGYSIFSDGVYRSPISYYRVLDANGNVLIDKAADAASVSKVVLSRENAAIMTKLLHGVTSVGSAKNITLTKKLGVEAAGKTGTTQNNCDRLFVGYTPRLVCGVWMGCDYPTPLDGIGGNPTVKIWDDIMLQCERKYKNGDIKYEFDTPESVLKLDFCRESGCIPGADCSGASHIDSGYFTGDDRPQGVCDIHSEISETGEGEENILD